MLPKTKTLKNFVKVQVYCFLLELNLPKKSNFSSAFDSLQAGKEPTNITYLGFHIQNSPELPVWIRAQYISLPKKYFLVHSSTIL